MFLQIAAQAFEAGDFLNIFLRFWGFSGSFSYNHFSYKEHVQFTTKLKQIFQEQDWNGPTQRSTYNNRCYQGDLLW